MTWTNVQALRKSGRYQEAIELGLRHLADNPNDFKLRTQIDWAFYGEIKTQVSVVTAKLKAAQPVPAPVINQIHQELRRFAKQPKRRPDNALSNILREVSKIAPHFPTSPDSCAGLASVVWQWKIGSTASSTGTVILRSPWELHGD